MFRRGPTTEAVGCGNLICSRLKCLIPPTPHRFRYASLARKASAISEGRRDTLWAILAHLVRFVVDLLVGARRPGDVKDLEIAPLCQQVRLLRRRSSHPPRLSRWEQLTFAVVTAKLHRLVAGPQARLARAVLLVQPETVLRWHCDLAVSRRATRRH